MPLHLELSKFQMQVHPLTRSLLRVTVIQVGIPLLEVGQLIAAHGIDGLR
jgi:hypothetical protein